MSLPTNAFHGILHPEVREYLGTLPGADDPLLDRLEAFGTQRAHRFPLIGRPSGRCLELFTRAIGGRRVFEFGSGYGYSAFFFARAVGEGGQVIATETDAHEVDAHRTLFAGHPLAARIDLRLGDAFETLAATEGTFDACLLDLHKAAYPAALEAIAPRLRPGALLFADNTLWGGRLARPAEPDDTDTLALQAFNRALFADPRFQTVVLPVGDGLAVALKL